MAKKKSSSSKITITKATTVKTPTIKVLYAIESSKRRKEYVAKDGEGKAGSLYQ